MSNQNPLHESLLGQLKDYLKEERYNVHSCSWYLIVAHRFLSYLEKKRISVQTAQPADVSSYLRMELTNYRRRRGRLPKDKKQWSRLYTAAIHHLLRLAQGRWPPVMEPISELAVFQRQVCEGYVHWLAETKGLAQCTLEERSHRASNFLRWLGEHSMPQSLKLLTVSDIDAYLAWRLAPLRRTSRKGIVNCLRCFLRYLFTHGLLGRDLASAVTGPPLYALEVIPVALRGQDVQTVLATTRQDTTPVGRRDYAILMLLSTYGLRAGEVVRLRLEDLDWRRERLRIAHAKTGSESFLPLLEPVGNALLDYLRYGRPKTEIREIFLRSRAPYRSFRDGSSLYSQIARRLRVAGVSPQGKHGPHAFRYACAISLLKAKVSIKTIGDILGHRSTESTGVYLKLASEDLRKVGLEVPGEVTR